MSIQYEDCAIVSMGCFLPDAAHPEEFWQNLEKNSCSIKPISLDRWDKNINYSPYREMDDKTYSHWGAEISQKSYDLLQNKWAPQEMWSRLELMSMETFSQAHRNLNLVYDPKRVGLMLGCMNPDEYYFITRFKKNKSEVYARVKNIVEEEKNEKIKRGETVKPESNEEELFEQHCKRLYKDIPDSIDTILPTSILHKISKKFNIEGTSFLIDAACASGIASLDCAVSYLQSGKLDFVFAGAIESNLGQGAFVLFSKVGALATERTLPFDKRSQGLSQGEGSVIFGVERLSDALKNKRKIHGIIKSVGSSSDGRVASLFQPDFGGQILALERAYSSLEGKQIDYLEAHGTGTQIGDYTEERSASHFFNNYKIPMGSVKSLIGHTKATAGAAGLLKCLLMMENRKIPAVDYMQEPILSENSDLFFLKNEFNFSEKTSQIRCGISSFGFGGTNFHLVVDSSPDPKNTKNPQTSEKFFKSVFLGQSRMAFQDFDENWFTKKDSFYKIPPKSIPFIDKAQLLAVQVTAQLMQNVLKIPLTTEDRDRVQVISASSIGLDILNNLVNRISLDTLFETMRKDQDVEHFVETVKKVKNTYPRTTEESGPGILNNVIAGRVCNAFHFRGRNFNIDADIASVAAAIELAKIDIQLGKTDFVIIIGIDEEVHLQDFKVERKQIGAFALASDRFAKKYFLNIKSEIE